MDRINLLESKVKEMITMVQSLQGENSALKSQLADARERSQSLHKEREVLDEERSVVRDRIEQLLGDLAQVQDEADTAQEPAVTPFRAMEGGKPEPRPTEQPLPSANPIIPGLS